MNPTQTPAPTLLALSGGVDSMVLLNKLYKDGKQQIHAITVDHRLREGSGREVEEIHDYIKKKYPKVIHKIITWEEGVNVKTSIEEEARDARYKILIDYAKENKIEDIYLAHHLNDNIETFFMRLERGSGLKGLTVMSEKTQRDCVNLIRPLLNTTKKEIIQHAKDNNIKYWEDETNQDVKIHRNKIRKILSELKDSELMESRVERVIKSLQGDYEIIKKVRKRNYKEIYKDNKINISEFTKLTRSEQFYLIQDIIEVERRAVKINNAIEFILKGESFDLAGKRFKLNKDFYLISNN